MAHPEEVQQRQPQHKDGDGRQDDAADANGVVRHAPPVHRGGDAQDGPQDQLQRQRRKGQLERCGQTLQELRPHGAPGVDGAPLPLRVLAM